jgi:hypothetical protein
MTRCRLALLGLASLLAACKQDDRATQTLEAALEVRREDASPPATPGASWTGEPLSVTEIGPDSWTALELPELPSEPLDGTRLADAWLLRSPDDATRTYTDERLTLWRDEAQPRLIAEGVSARRVHPLGGETLVSVEDDGDGYHLRLVGEQLERVELPIGHLVQLGERRFVATGWSLSDTSFRVVELGPEGLRTVFESEQGVRTVGMGVIGERLVVGVQHRDASASAPVEARVHALTELEQGRGEAAAALAGPARSHLLEIDLATGETRTEPFPEQRMQNLAVLEGGWIVVVGEGTLAKGLRDAVIVARAPDETGGWRLLARDLELSLAVEAGGRWICMTTSSIPGQELHCISPELGRHVVTPSFSELVAVWDIAALDGRTQLVFRVSARSSEDVRVLALPLE